MKVIQLVYGKGYCEGANRLWALTNTGRIFELDTARTKEGGWTEIDIPYECDVEEEEDYAK